MSKRTTQRNENPRDFLKLMKNNGWSFDRNCKSSHTIMKKGDQKVAIKKSKFNIVIQRRLIKELNLV